MIQKFDRAERRILSFPAVRPCESVEPAILTDSLIAHSRAICGFQSELFVTQRRNARETVRQSRILLEFFEDVRERGPVLPCSAVLCFSELHTAFQKIRFLLEDCSCEGARVWILMRSQFVAAQFRALARAIGTALDVLPLDSIDAGGEVKELVELVAKQARRANFELDSRDEYTMRQVRSMLLYFDKGIEPDRGVIERVLDYLDIRSWSDCNKEIKFLEGEINFECSEGKEREAPLLSSLMAFMSYCRVVLFEVLDHRSTQQSDVTHNLETLSCLNPEDFRCPISLELMTDPVTVSTGQTYDRSSIQRWLKAGNITCPKTGERLASTELVPNSALRKLIKHFCADNGISLANSGRRSSDITRTIVPGSTVAAEAMKKLSKFLARRLVFGTTEQKHKAAYEIRLLAKSNIFNRTCLIEAGTVLPLLNLLSSADAATQENATAALLKLSKHTSGKRVIVDCGGLSPILSVLRKGSSLEARQIAAATIFYLSSVKGYRKLIGETPDAIPALVDLIRNGKPCGKQNAVVAIFGLLLYPGNQCRVIAAGTIPLLVNVLASSERDDLIVDSLAVLASLAENADGTVAILRTPVLPLIIGFLQSAASKPGKEYSVSILLALCSNGGSDTIEVLARDSSLTASLYSLLTDGTSHASKKARSLLKILLNFNERNRCRFS
ncbi:U-box domain-containing protein 18-like [Rhodamnia argentea]|uniref:RING-type E3 ubiquitin transferase n=1 Tax=Rhodamnia argentea TaxID=178133 RepID=A0A8B8P8E9_9MYRT|nr:U-box domain-containing protein 18-like [Rhodamnia argentea]